MSEQEKQEQQEMEQLKQMPLQEETAFEYKEDNCVLLEPKENKIFKIPYGSLVKFSVDDKFLIVEYKG